MKKRLVIDLCLNLVLVISTAIAVGVYFTGKPDVLGSVGAQCLKYFTTDSNILAAIGSGVAVFFCARQLRTPCRTMPHWARVLKFAGTVAVTLTLLTVVFFLAPMAYGKGGMASVLRFFQGNVFVLHLSTPVLALVSLLLLEREETIRVRDALWGLAPTAAYSIVYFLMVVVFECWTDWYGFTFGGKAYMIPVAFVSMYLATLAISAVLRRLGRRKAQEE